MSKFILPILLSLTLFLAACTPAAATPEEIVKEDSSAETIVEKTDAGVQEEPTEAAMETSPTASDVQVDAMQESPAWFGVTLTDIQTGKSFTINDLKGKVVLVEALAMWCSNCKTQQLEIKDLLEELGSDTDLVTIGMDIDPNEMVADLAAYVKSNGFDWIYVISPADVTREIANLYGDQFLNPPSTPMLLVDRKGEVHVLPFRIKSANTLREFIQPFLDEEL